MVDNTKTSRIFKLLSEAQERGVKEIELFDDFERPNTIRVLKHRLNKILGGNAIVIRNGIWYLGEEYWNMTKTDFLNQQVMYYINRFTLTLVSLVAVFAVLLVVAWSVGYNVGRPDTIEQCLDIFGYDALEVNQR